MHSYSHENGKEKSPLVILTLLALCVAVVANWLFSLQDWVPSWMASAPTVAGAYALLYFLLDKYAWKWRVLHALGVIHTPVISGKYLGTLVSSNSLSRPIEIQIDQTWNRMVVRFEIQSPTSSYSLSFAASLISVGHESARLIYVYRNQTQPGAADLDMGDHEGTAELTINIQSGQLKGRYYNYRGNKGSLELARQNQN